MSISVIQLTLNQVALIKGASEAAYPKEACGLIAGRLVSEGVLSVTRIVRSNNILAATTDDRFEIDPSDRIELEKMIRGTLETLIAHYHSHPDKDAVPSSIDLMNTHEPNLVWVIVSVKDGKAVDITAHQVGKDRTKFDKIEIVIS